MKPLQLPDDLHKQYHDARWDEISVGHSRDSVYRITTVAVLYLKIGADLQREHDSLVWLGQHLPVPQVLHFSKYEAQDYLLTTSIAGDMVHEVDLPPLQRVQIMADGLRRFHAVPTDNCPLDFRLDAKMQLARDNIAHGLIEEDDLPERYAGLSVSEAFAKLEALPCPEPEDVVVSHGDYCLPNILIDPTTQKLTGFIDLGRAGLSDRYFDLVVGAWSIEYNLGKGWEQHFFEAYGIDPDPLKLEYYRLLNCFL